ncbi:MAG TPA: protein kinase [Thermoanaerobaculia bacterium]
MPAACSHHHTSSDELGGLCPICLLGVGLGADEPHETTVVRGSDDSDSSGDPLAGDVNRVTPGTTLGGRFRVTGMIGAGGMGEVYRADDLKLGQPVALKFLTSELAATPESLSRLYAEVRLGRQVAHPNVCRIYDVVEFGHHRCIVMEYVDGEDLASLLKRIGRLSQRKAAAISRDLCLGLAASHQAGIVHGDLKPSNVMIDGRGRARIMDFGLSRLATESADAAGMIAGTPAYMAPEQLEGSPPSFAADVYALGLIGWELFTGTRLREGKSLSEIRESAPENVEPPSASGVNIDPSAEAIILACLDPDPARRPPTASDVLARFPGRDPLDEAIAAGETPTPELVAAAERSSYLSPLAAAGLVAAIGAEIAILGIAPGPGNPLAPPVAVSGAASGTSSVAAVTYVLLLMASLVAGSILARRNIRARRVDYRGALRTSSSVFLCWMAYWLFTADHARSLAAESAMLADALGEALFNGARVWLGYMALEPYVRRSLPSLIIGWNRLVASRVADPLVGRDVLIGLAAGAGVRIVELLRHPIASAAGIALPAESRTLAPLASAGDALGAIAYVQTRAVFYAFFGLFILLLFRLAFRNGWAAAVGWVALATLIWAPAEAPAVEVPLTVVRMALLLLVLTRGGLLAFAAALYADLLLPYLAWVAPSAVPQAVPPLVLAGAIVLLAVWSFRAAMAHRTTLPRPALVDRVTGRAGHVKAARR